MNKQIKYAVFCYDTENIGDEIQSIAAMRFLPQIDYYINRDNIDQTVFKPNEEVKIIMNGWYLHSSVEDQKRHWPPKNSAIQPLLISMHVSPIVEATNNFSTDASRKFLQKFSPVGARDFATKEFFESINIPTFFSGCLTLTLLPDKNVKKSDFVLAVDVDNEILNNIQKRTNRRIINLSTYHSAHLTTNERFAMAKYWLYLYQSAHCIVTNRLHAILPSLALGTPVIAISDTSDSVRYTGLIDLANHYTKKEFLRNKSISLDKPLRNPKSYIKIRNDLVRICSSYTNFDSKESYLGKNTIDDILNSLDFRSFIAQVSQESFTLAFENEQLRKNQAKLETEINRFSQPLGTIASAKSLANAIKRMLEVRILHK